MKISNVEWNDVYRKDKHFEFVVECPHCKREIDVKCDPSSGIQSIKWECSDCDESFNIRYKFAVKIYKAVKKKKKKKPTLPPYLRKLKPSKKLSEIVGSKSISRTEVVRKFWKYIKKNKLQNPKDLRMIIADQKLYTIFKKKQVSMFEIPKILRRHLS